MKVMASKKKQSDLRKQKREKREKMV